jgi:transglutaminase-like putative cysteine protease
VIYAVRHLTTYSYDSEVAYARCALRLTPTTNALQTLLESSISVTPGASAKTIKTDPYGGQVVSMIIDTPHDELVIESRCLVDVHAGEIGPLGASWRWEDVRDAGLQTHRLDAESPALFLSPTRVTPIEPAITEYARASFAPGRAVLEAADELMRRLRSEFAYDPEATDVRTPAASAFEQRRGVCQDFAHVMICGLRGLGLPARYVSGYIRTIPAPGQPRLEGADATHAWISLWCGEERGWIGLDPTNNTFTGADHVTVAHGRDYQDVAPIEGVLLGAGRQKLKVEVDVVEAAGPGGAVPSVASGQVTG